MKIEDSRINIGEISDVHTSEITIVGRDIVGFTAEQVSDLLKQIGSAFQPRPFTGECPYVGLQAFSEADAERFFGREIVIEQLIKRLKEVHFLFVIGPSGSGKSSLLRAGLLPALLGGALPASQHWLYTTLTPGRDPLEELARSASRLARDPEAGDYIRNNALEDSSALYKLVESALGDQPEQRALIFVDQFEELFTQVIKESARVAFLKMLVQAATVNNGRVVVITAMRSDFVANCSAYPQLNALLNQGFFQVGAMQPEELVRAVASPAMQVGLEVDPDLIAQIINDMGGEPGALPLMQFALRDLFESGQAEGGLMALTLEAYLARGGIYQALQRHADAEFARLNAVEKDLARDVFAYLIQVGRGVQDTRRTALWAELTPAGVESDQVRVVVRKLADARLVTTDEHTVELAHERLLDAWPWLRRLVDENREIIALQNEIAADALEWQESGRDDSYLYSGARLAAAREKIDTGKLILSEVAQKFIDAGLQSEAALRLRAAHRRNLLLAGSIIVAVVMSVLGFIAWNQSQVALDRLGVSDRRGTQVAEQAISLEGALVEARLRGTQAIAESTRAAAAQVEAEQQRDQAERQARAAFSRQLAVQAQAAHDRFPQRSILLAVEALNVTRQVDELTQPAALSGLIQSIQGLDGIPLGGSTVMSADGRWLVVERQNGERVLLDLAAPSLHEVSALHSKDLLDLQMILSQQGGHTFFSMDSSRLGLVHESGTISTWTLSGSTPYLDPWELAAPEMEISFVELSPDGNWLAVRTTAFEVWLWRLSGNGEEFEPWILREPHAKIQGFAFSPDSRWLITTSHDAPYDEYWYMDDAYLWSLESLAQGGAYEPLPLTAEQKVQGYVFSPDGHWLVTYPPQQFGTDQPGVAWLWDLSVAGGGVAPEMLSGHLGAIDSAVFSPGGRWLFTSGEDTFGLLWDLSAADPARSALILEDASSGSRPPLFSPDGLFLLTIAPVSPSQDTISIWDLGSSGSGEVTHWPVRFTDIEQVVFQPQGFSVAVLDRYLSSENPQLTYLPLPRNIFSQDEYGLVYDVQELSNLDGTPASVDSMAFSPDGFRFAVSSNSGAEIYVWDVPYSAEDFSQKPLVLYASEAPWVSTQLVAPVDAPAITTGGLAFSADGRWLVAKDRLFDMWLEDYYPLRSVNYPQILPAPEPAGFLYAVSPDNRWMLAWHPQYLGSVPAYGRPESSGDDWQAGLANAYLWDLNDLVYYPVSFHYLEDEDDPLLFSPDGRWLAFGHGESVSLWRLSDLDQASVLAAQVLTGGRERLPALAFSGDSRWLAASSWDGRVYLWELQEAGPDVVKSEYTLPGQAPLGPVAISPDGHWLFAGAEDGSLFAWDLEAIGSRSQPLRLQHQDQSLYSLTIDSQSRCLVVGTMPAQVLIYDLVSFGPDARPIEVQDLEDPGRTHPEQIVFSPDGQWLAIDDRLFRVADLLSDPTTAPVRIGNWIGRLGFSPDNRWLVTQPADMIGFSNHPYPPGPGGGGTFIQPPGYEETMSLWAIEDWPAGSLQPILLPSWGEFAFSPDSRWLAVGMGSKGHLYDLLTLEQEPGTPAVELVTESMALGSVVFTSDSDTLVSGMSVKDRNYNYPRLMLAWDLDLDRLIKIACQVVGRNLAMQEWMLYFSGEPYDPAYKTCPQWDPGE
jgi:WD40 repeat protein